MWAPDGQELFYRSNTGLTVVPIKSEPSFAAGTPEVVVEDQFYGTVNLTDAGQNAGEFGSIMLRSPQPTRRKIVLAASDDERPAIGAYPVETDSE